MKQPVDAPMRSRTSPTSTDTTGTLQASASLMTLGDPSYIDVSRTASAALIQTATSLWGRPPSACRWTLMPERRRPPQRRGEPDSASRGVGRGRKQHVSGRRHRARVRCGSPAVKRSKAPRSTPSGTIQVRRSSIPEGSAAKRLRDLTVRRWPVWRLAPRRTRRSAPTTSRDRCSRVRRAGQSRRSRPERVDRERSGSPRPPSRRRT